MTGTSININRIPIHKEGGGEIDAPNLDIDGEDEPINFLFSMDNGSGIIAPGNLQLLRGAPKSGKSAWGLILMAAALKGECLGIKVNRKGLNVLWIDTEQDKAVVRKKGRAVLDMAGIAKQPKNLIVVSLRGYSKAERLAITIKKINDYTPDFVFLDGVADLCRDFNDNVESEAVVDQLQKCSEQYEAAILGVIHTNKKDDEAKGHLGGYLQQKCSEIYQGNKQPGANITKIKQALTRFEPAPDFAFSYGDNFRLTTAEEAQQRASDEARKKLCSVFAQIFEDGKRRTRGELAKAYAEAVGCSERTANSEISKAVKSRILYDSKEGRNTFYTYLFPDLPNNEDDDEEL